MREKLNAFANAVTDFMALIGAVAVVAMLVHIVAYVISRHVMASPIPATVEIVSRYYMVAIAFLPIAWADKRGDMISVEVFGWLLAGALKRANAIVITLVTVAAYLTLTYTTWLIAMREFAAKSFTISLSIAVPTWPSYFLLPVAFGLASLVALLRLGLLLTGEMPQQKTQFVLEKEAS